MAGHAGRRARAGAEAERIGAEFGLGRHVKAWWRGPKVVEWALVWGFLIDLPVSIVVAEVTATGPSGRLSVPAIGMLLVVIALPVVIASRTWPVVHEFEAGVATVTRYRRRVSVLRWADLVSVDQPVSIDEDGKERVYGYVLRGRAGNALKVGKLPGLADRAEQVLAGRLSRPAN
jgi:hypothetical protein